MRLTLVQAGRQDKRIEVGTREDNNLHKDVRYIVYECLCLYISHLI